MLNNCRLFKIGAVRFAIADGVYLTPMAAISPVGGCTE